MRVYPRHQRAARICMNGARRWFRMRGLDFRAYLKDGIDAEVLRALDDPISNRALAAAEAESRRD